MLLIRAKLRSALVSRQWLWDSRSIKCGLSSSLASYNPYLSFSGPRSRLSHQSRQNVICVKGLKRGGYKIFGSKNHWTQTKSRKGPTDGLSLHGQIQVLDLFGHHCLGNTVLSLCGGSGSLMEACMLSGRSCLMFECDGSFHFLLSFL